MTYMEDKGLSEKDIEEMFRKFMEQADRVW